MPFPARSVASRPPARTPPARRTRRRSAPRGLARGRGRRRAGRTSPGWRPARWRAPVGALLAEAAIAGRIGDAGQGLARPRRQAQRALLAGDAEEERHAEVAPVRLRQDERAQAPEGELGAARAIQSSIRSAVRPRLSAAVAGVDVELARTCGRRGVGGGRDGHGRAGVRGRGGGRPRSHSWPGRVAIRARVASGEQPGGDGAGGGSPPRAPRPRRWRCWLIHRGFSSVCLLAGAPHRTGAAGRSRGHRRDRAGGGRERGISMFLLIDCRAGRTGRPGRYRR